MADGDPLYGDLEVRRPRLARGSVLPSYAPTGTRSLEPTYEDVDMGRLLKEAALAGGVGGAVGAGAGRSAGAANWAEIERLNKEFMIDRARRRARQGLGGTSLEDLGDYAGAVFSEEGRAAHTGAGRYIPYGDRLPYDVRARLGVDGGDMAPVTLRDGQRVGLSSSDLLDPETRISIERRLADMVSGGTQAGPEGMEEMLRRSELLSRDATNPRFSDYAGVERPISDIDFGRSGISREYAELAHPYAKERADFARSPAGEAGRSAQARVNRANQLVEALKQSEGDELLRPGRYAPMFTPEQRGYPLEDLSPGQTSRVLHPADTASNWNLLDNRGLPSSFEQADIFTEAGQGAYNRGLEGNVYFDKDPSGKMSAFALPGRDPLEDALETSLYVQPESDTPRRVRIREELSGAEEEVRRAIRARTDLYDQRARRPSPAIPTRMSRLGSALKSGARAALGPVGIAKDLLLGSVVGAGSAGLGYASAAPGAGGLFTPPGPGYEGVVTPEGMERVADEREFERQARRDALMREAIERFGPQEVMYSLPQGVTPETARIEDIASLLGPLR